MFKGTMTKWPEQKQTHRTTQKHKEHQDSTDSQKNIFFVLDNKLFLIQMECVAERKSWQKRIVEVARRK